MSWTWCAALSSWAAHAGVTPAEYTYPVAGSNDPDLSGILPTDGEIDVFSGSNSFNFCTVNYYDPHVGYYDAAAVNWQPITADAGGTVPTGTDLYVIVSGPNYDITDPQPTWDPSDVLSWMHPPVIHNCSQLVSTSYISGLPAGSAVSGPGGGVTLDASHRWYFAFSTSGGSDTPNICRVSYPSLDGAARETVHVVPSGYVTNLTNYGILGMAYLDGNLWWVRNQGGYGTEHAGIYIEGGSLASLPITNPSQAYGALVGQVAPAGPGMHELQKIDDLVAIGDKLYAVRRRGVDAYTGSAGIEKIPPTGRPFQGAVTSEIIEIDPIAATVTVLHTEIGTPIFQAPQTFYWGDGAKVGTPLAVDDNGGLWGLADFGSSSYRLWRYDTVTSTFTQTAYTPKWDYPIMVGTQDASLLLMRNGLTDLYEVPGATMTANVSTCITDGFEVGGHVAWSPTFDVIAWVDLFSQVWQLENNVPCVPPTNTDPTTATELACPSGMLDGDACGSDNGVWFRLDPVGPTSINFTVVASNGQSYLMGETATDELFDGVTDAMYIFEVTETTWVQLFTGVPGPYSIAWSCCVHPTNDNWADAEEITGASGTLSATNICSSNEVGETLPGGRGEASVWYKWTALADGPAMFNTLGSVFVNGGEWDSVLWAYTGSTLASLTEVAYNDDDPDTGGLTSRITFDAIKGTLYYIRVGAYNPGGFANFILNWEAAQPSSTVWYQWTPSRSGTLSLSLISDCLGILDTDNCINLDVFIGTDLANLNLIVSHVNYPDSVLSLRVDANETYWIRVRK